VPVLVLVSVSVFVSDMVTILSVSVDVTECWVTVTVSVAVTVVSLPSFFCLCSSMELPLLAAASAAASALDVVDGSSLGCLPPSLAIEGSLLLPLIWAGVAGGAGVTDAATAAPSVSDGFTASLTTALSSVGDVCVVVVALALAFRPLSSGRSNDLVVNPFSTGLLGVADTSAAAGDSGRGSGVEETESNRGSCSDELVDVANCCVVSRVFIYFRFCFILYVLMLLIVECICFVASFNLVSYCFVVSIIPNKRLNKIKEKRTNQIKLRTCKLGQRKKTQSELSISNKNMQHSICSSRFGQIATWDILSTWLPISTFNCLNNRIGGYNS